MKQTATGSAVRRGTAESEPSIELLGILRSHPRLADLDRAERERALADLSTLSSRLKRVRKLSDSFGRITLNPSLLNFMHSNGIA